MRRGLVTKRETGGVAAASARQIGLITTLETNIGDDLVREGIILILQEVLGTRQLHFVMVNKHRPLTVYPGWHPVHLSMLAGYLPRGRIRVANWAERVFSKLSLTCFDDCDLIVQCGAPVLWPACHLCEWAEPLWHHVVGRLAHRTPVLNLAAGSCYPWEHQPAEITDPDEVAYLRAILGYCRLTTTRDPLAESLCATLGTQTPLLPCSALLAAGQRMAPRTEDSFVLLNYMEGGGHYDWNQGICRSRWERTMRQLVECLGRRHKLVFLCHNEAEYRLAEKLAPSIPRWLPKTPYEFFTMGNGAKLALCNRLHASVALAGLGIPSVSVGTDTRMLMLEPIGLPYFYVEDAHAGTLEHAAEGLMARREQERERLLELRERTWNKYCDAVARAIQN
jgi:hypothetical protein